MPTPSSTRFAHAHDGAAISWSEAGTGEPLLLISGQAVDSTSWDAVIPALSERHRVIRFDHRGTGRSDVGTDSSYSTAAFARDAITVLDNADVERAHMYGHSMGGRVAQCMAIDFPSRIGALILGATTAGDTRGVQRSEQATADLASGDPDRLAALFFRDGRRRADADAFFNLTATRHARRLHFAASSDHDTWDLLPGITAPTLVIHGTADRMTPPENARRIAALIPVAELALLPDARHGYYLDDPRASDRVLKLLERHRLEDGVQPER